MAWVEKHLLPPPKETEFNFGDWTISVTKSHILGSQCENPKECSEENLCSYCSYEKKLKMPSLPDMVFDNNKLRIIHTSGGGIEFNAFEAIKCVSNKAEKSLAVAHAPAWKEARAGCEHSTKAGKNYDWTYTTNYRGTVIKPLRVEQTSERINLDNLRVREEIKFFEEIYLYEDELDDNGSTKCTVKIRVMPSGFFAVFRHYLRVDHVLVRVNDTRLYHREGTDYLLRESSTREEEIPKLDVLPTVYKNPDLIWEHLPLVKEEVDKLSIF